MQKEQRSGLNAIGTSKLRWLCSSLCDSACGRKFMFKREGWEGQDQVRVEVVECLQPRYTLGPQTRWSERSRLAPNVAQLPHHRLQPRTNVDRVRIISITDIFWGLSVK